MKLDSKFYSFFEHLYNFFLLNIIWIVMCLPIITIVPSTSALFGVVREWKINKDGRVFQLFFSLFKNNFKQSLLLEILLAFVIYLLTVDFMFAKQISSPFNMVLLPVFMLLALAVLFTFSFIFSVIVHIQGNWREVIKNSFLFSISHPSLAVSSLFVLGCAAVLIWVLPITGIIIVSPSAYVIFSFCQRAFQKVESIQNNGVR